MPNDITQQSEEVKIDANQLLQDWKRLEISEAEQVSRVRAWLTLSKPLIVKLAEQAGAADEIEKRDAIKKVVDLARTLNDDDREFYARRLAKAMKMQLSEWRGQVKVQKNGKEASNSEDVIRTAGGWIQHHLVELFFDREKMRTLLAVRYPDGRVSDLMDHVVIEGKTYKPIFPTSTMIKKIVLMPSELGEQMSEDELLALTSAHINKYFDFGADKFFEELTPLYVPFTYNYDAFTEVSYLRGLGDYGTGKTRFIKTVGKICYRPVYISGGSSAASIYHLLDTFHGTLVLNEGDFNQSDESSIIAKILNGGTEKDEAVTKMKKDGAGNMDVEAYNVFGPKVICTRKEFDDRAIKSRCLTMDMVPFQPRPDIPISSPPRKELEELELRNLWTTYRIHHAQETIEVDEKLVNREIEPRLNQITMSLMATISDEKVRDRLKNFLNEYNLRTKEERNRSQTARVVEGLVIANAWGPASDHPADQDRVYLKDVTRAANMRIDEMKRLEGEEEDEEEVIFKKDGSKIKKKSKMTSRGVSVILEKYCQIATRRTSNGTDEYRGTMEVVWDELRVKSLCQRYGVEWMERGSIQRPVEVIVDLNKPSPGLNKLREDWYATGKEED